MAVDAHTRKRRRSRRRSVIYCILSECAG